LRRKDRYYVCIDHLDDSQLEIFGWYKIREGDDFVIYARPYGAEQQIVDKHGKRFLLVDDLSEAMQMKGSVIIGAPEEPTRH